MCYSLSRLFELSAGNCESYAAPRRAAPGELFDEDEAASGQIAEKRPLSAPDIAIIGGLHNCGGADLSALPESARRFFELSVNAFDAVVHAWMS